MYAKDGSYVVSMENSCKLAIKIDSLIWVGQASILEKMFKWEQNICMSYFLFLKNGDLTHSYSKINV
jgi:hypothetical protein